MGGLEELMGYETTHLGGGEEDLHLYANAFKTHPYEFIYIF